MGKDARIVIRLKQLEKPTEDQLDRWSLDICDSIGALNFHTSDGLPRDKYKAAFAEWHTSLMTHPLYPKSLDDCFDVYEQIFAEIGKPPNELIRAIDLTEDEAITCPEDCEEENPVGHGKVYYQDFDSVYASNEEWLLYVSLTTRWYGIGYERGDLMTICAVDDWVRANMPGAEVWYGHDGGTIEHFTTVIRSKLLDHYARTSVTVIVKIPA